MDAVDNLIPFWATSHRDLGCPWATLPILDFRIPVIGHRTTAVHNHVLIACSVVILPPDDEVLAELLRDLVLVENYVKVGTFPPQEGVDFHRAVTAE
jgi:hypothetical protein